jgi:hypothetical protein
MANQFLDIFREFAGRRMQEEQFGKSLDLQGRELDLRKQTLADSNARFDQQIALQKQQQAQAEQQTKFAQTQAQLQALATGMVKDAPTRTTSLAPFSPSPSTTSDEQLGDFPSALPMAQARSSLHNQELTANLPDPNAMWFGDRAVTPTTPDERQAQANLGLLDFQDMVAKAASKRMEDDAMRLYPDKPFMQKLHIASGGKPYQLMSNPDELEAFAIAQSSTDMPTALEAVAASQKRKAAMRASTNPWAAMASMMNYKNAATTYEGNTTAGDAVTQVDRPQFDALDNPGKIAYLRKKIMDKPNLDGGKRAAALAQVDNMFQSPNPPKGDEFLAYIEALK